MKYKNNLVLISVLILMMLLSGCATDNTENIDLEDLTEDYQESSDLPTYGLIAGFLNEEEMSKTFVGKPLSFEYSLFNPQSAAEWGIEVYIEGVLQTITVYSGDTLLAENTSMFVSYLDNQETLDLRIEFNPNIGDVGETLELNVCSFLYPSYMVEGTENASFLPYHRLSPGATMTISMQQPCEDLVIIDGFDGTYKAVPLEIQNSFNSLNQFGDTVNTFDQELIFDVCKSSETDSTIQLDTADNIVKVFGYGKPGKYRISVYVNNQLIRAFNNSCYCDVEIKKGQEFIIDVPIDIKNQRNHIYVVAFDLESNKEATNDYVKSNTKLLIKD